MATKKQSSKKAVKKSKVAVKTQKKASVKTSKKSSKSVSKSKSSKPKVVEKAIKITKGMFRRLIQFQENEITEYFIYRKLAKSAKTQKNKEVLVKISDDELRHYKICQKYTNKRVKPRKGQIVWYTILAKVFGLTFALKLMERGEHLAGKTYDSLVEKVPELAILGADEKKHEKMLINTLQEKRLENLGSIVLGLNDALVELTGVLAGLTIALKSTSLVAMTGLVTGVAASLSMGASEYLSQKAEGNKHPLQTAFYTWGAYFFTVAFLIAPYLLLKNIWAAFAGTMFNAILIILGFTFYMSVAKDMNFKHRFLEMVAISMGVAILSFGVGQIIHTVFGIAI